MGSLLYLEAAVRVNECALALINRDVIAQDICVPWITHAPLNTFYVSFILAVTNKGHWMVTVDAKLFFQLAVRVSGMSNTVIEFPRFCHPASSNRIYNATGDCGGTGQLRTAYQENVVSCLFQSPSNEAASKTGSNDNISLTCHDVFFA
ncbi:MAG: hypothetical protein ACJAYS_001232 [Lentimonas sp.]|jgi:hypothetical protein